MVNSTVTILDIYFKLIEAYIPVFCVSSVVSIVGILGNIFTIGFFYKDASKSSGANLMWILAWVDLGGCFIFFVNLAEMGFSVMFTVSFPCKLTHFIIHGILGASVLTISVMSIDRYLKVCRPLRRQLTVKEAQRSAAIVISFSFVLSGRIFITYNTVEYPIELPDYNLTLSGYACNERNPHSPEVVVFVFQIIEILLLVFVCIELIVTNAHVAYSLKQHNRLISRSFNKEVRIATRQHDSVAESEMTGSSVATDTDVSDVPDYQSTSKLTESTEDIKVNRTNQREGVTLSTIQLSNEAGGMRRGARHASSSSQPRLSRMEKRITVFTLAVSLGFLLCYIPYVIFFTTWDVTGTSHFDRASVLQRIPIQLPYLNSVINPVLYFALNKRYRYFVKNLCCKCK